jgi:hypothetical protein
MSPSSADSHDVKPERLPEVIADRPGRGEHEQVLRVAIVVVHELVDRVADRIGGCIEIVGLAPVDGDRLGASVGRHVAPPSRRYSNVAIWAELRQLFVRSQRTQPSATDGRVKPRS